jgi:L-ascorbate metabolism protein UlaG (beta-lactamase superfamily)
MDCAPGEKPMKLNALAVVLALLLLGCGPAATATHLPPTTPPVSPAAAVVRSTAFPAPPIASPLLPTATETGLIPPATSAATPIAPSYFEGVRVTYIFNAGFLITAGDKRILVDALYEGYPEGVLKPLLESQPPFDGVDLILATHEHVDHFSAGMVRQYMLDNPGTAFLSTQGAADQLLALGDDLRSRVTAIQIGAGESARTEVDGITVDAVYLSHGIPGLLNLGFLITIGDVHLFHTGDVDLETVGLRDLQPYDLPNRQIDLAFVPADFFTGEAYYPLLQEGIRARFLIPMHFYGRLSLPASFASLFPEHYTFSESYESWVLPAGSGAEQPSARLRFNDLMYGFEYSAPVDEAALTPPERAVPARSFFEGRLELLGEKEGGRMQVLRGEMEPEYAYLPEFDFEFVHSNGFLIPAQRGAIVGEHRVWNLILEPGRTWQDGSDAGYSRASLPFALTVKGGNATFNGTLTFLFDDMHVSKVWYQITQETTTGTRADLWGLLDATYHPGPVAGAQQIRAAFASELAARLPVKPIQALAEDYPGVDVSAFGQGVTPEHMTWYGVVVDGVNYLGGCQTRYGVYPYCESMRATSYSTAKSAFVSVALMRLAQEYDAEVGDLLVKDYLPEAAASPGDWDRVTFNHTIDMSTGNYLSPAYMADEDGARMGEFFGAQPYAARIAAALDWPHAAEPGTHWVYRTGDTFILTRALHNYLQRRQGPDADIYRYVVEGVYRPLGLGPGAFTTLRTADDGWQGQAEGGYGLWWIPDDIAKIATLLNNDAGAIDGVQVLEPALLSAALQRDPEDRGVRIDNRRMYNNAFWADRYTPADGFDCEFWVLQMLGVSGNVVALIPNGVTYYYFSDNREFTWDAALVEADKIAPLCPAQ